MGSYLNGADIHDFLSCLGKRAVENVTFGFTDLKRVESECFDIVFVEDTDELADGADGFNLGNKEEKQATLGGWGESIQKEDNSGWDMEPNNEAKNDAMPANTGWAMVDDPPQAGGGWGSEPNNEAKNDVMPLNTGWAMTDNPPQAGGGWGGKQVAVSDNGWDSMVNNEVAQKASTPIEGGSWAKEQLAVSDNGWDSMSKSEVNTRAPVARSDNWDSMEGRTPPDGGKKGMHMHPSRRSMNASDSTENYGASERRSGNFAPSGTNTVPLGTRRNFVKADVRAGLTDVKQCEEREEDIGWGTCGQTAVAGDDIGWGSSTREEGKPHANTTQQRPGQDNWASQMDCETLHAEPESESLKKDNLGSDAWQERETSNMSGWKNDDDWNCKDKSEAHETAPANPPNSWDAMEGQNVRKGGQYGGHSHPSKTKTDNTESTVKQFADDRRSGRFGPSGSNMVPLGKRKSAMKSSDVDNNESESLMMKNTQISEGKQDQMGWANCQQTATVDDTGWNNSNQNKRESDKNISERVPDEDEWASEAGWGKVSIGHPSQVMKDDNMGTGDWNSQPEGESASADSHGWGAEVHEVNNVQGDGWGDGKSDAPSIPCSNYIRKPSATNWDSGGFNSFGTRPSTGPLEQDGTPRPRKKFNRGSADNSWAGVASFNPEPQSRRYRIRSLINAPEYSELNELYKATNKILHHSEYQPGDKLNPEDDKFILEKILVHHLDKEAKVGCGVDYVMIDFHAEHQVSCFWVVRKDGSKSDFSYWKCLEGLFETKYSQGVTKDVVKDEAKDGWNWVADSADPSKRVCDAEEVIGGWDMGASSAPPTRSKSDQEEKKDGWGLGASSAPTRSKCDLEKTQNGWDMEDASSAAPTESLGDQGEAKDSWDIGAKSATPTMSTCNQEEAKNSWDMGPISAAPIKSVRNEEEAKDSWGMGDSSAAPNKSNCDQDETQNSGDMGAISVDPTKSMCNQEEAKDSWDMEASLTAPIESVCDEEEAKDSWG